MSNNVTILKIIGFPFYVGFSLIRAVLYIFSGKYFSKFLRHGLDPDHIKFIDFLLTISIFFVGLMGLISLCVDKNPGFGIFLIPIVLGLFDYLWLNWQNYYNEKFDIN